jgi:hypothetical protein
VRDTTIEEDWPTIEFRDAGDDRVIALFQLIAKGAHSGLELERQNAITDRI